jgi:YVTN family beta-propeller protein
MRYIFPFLLTLCALAACSKDNTPVTPVDASKPGVYILNEGNFQRGNASLTYYIPEDGTVIADVYRQENKNGLGDTGNSLTGYKGRVYIVLNGTNTVEVIDDATKKRVKTITLPAGASPRYIAFDSHGRAYISCLYSNEVLVYLDSTDTILARIPVGANPEQMLIRSNKLFVTNSGLGAGSTVSVIDIASTEFPLLATLRVGDNPTAILPASTGSALVLCTGAYHDFNDPSDDTPGRLFEIDTENLRVSDSLILGGHPQRLIADAAGQFYTVAEDGILRIRWATRELTPRFIPGSFYSVYYHGSDDMLYVSEPLDYVQPGTVHLYTLSGLLRSSFTAGIIPGSML